jgi:F420-dependent oxidoreductase-like protein
MIPLGVQFRRPWTTRTDTVSSFLDDVRAVQSRRIQSVWFTEVFEYEPLALIAALTSVPDVRFGTAVAVSYARPPALLASEALTVQAASNNRLTLGLGPSHRAVVRDLLGVDDWSPVRDLPPYLDLLTQRLTDTAPAVDGSQPCEVLLAAMAPKMLDIAGALTNGTITSRAGERALEHHIVPRLRDAAAHAGRPEPRVVVILPLCVTPDVSRARGLVADEYRASTSLPSYRRVLALDGVDGPEDVALIGDEAAISRRMDDIEAAGATELVVRILGNTGDRRRALDYLEARAAVR